MKKVLIVVDYDPSARHVAETGFSLAQSMKAKIILLHVISPPAYYFLKENSPILGFSGFPNKNSLQPDNINGLRKSALYFLNLFKHHLGDKTIQIQIENESFEESILKTARNFNVDLIITGSHSRKWMENTGTENISEKVLNNASFPLYIVTTKKQITVPTETELIN